MRIDIRVYEREKPFIQEWFLEQTFFEPKAAASCMAAALHIPVIAICFYLGEVSNWHPDFLDNIESLIKCYNYTKIEGIPDSYPGRRL